jgi:hypothetical protein
MASGDAEHIAAGQLSQADNAALAAMLNQADALKAAISRVLQDRTREAGPLMPSGKASPVDAKPPTPSATPRPKADVEEKIGNVLHLRSSQNSLAIGDTTSSADDSAMQVD